MSSLGDSLKIKRAGEKAPAIVGMPPVATPDKAIEDYGSTGKSGGISAAKAKKNASSTPKTGEGRNLSSEFAKSISIRDIDSDKTVGYF